MGYNHSSFWFVLLPFSKEEGSFFGLHFLKIAIAGNSAGICLNFGGVCMQHNRQLKTVRAFYQLCIPYGTAAKPSFSPYGFHFYTTTVQSFRIQYSKEYTVRYNTALSPTSGGGSSPSGSIPRPSPLVTRARTCYHSLTISNLSLPQCYVNFPVSKSFNTELLLH